MDQEDDAIGIPEWVVTFGDMMSLLLTFFIMLVSLSEIKEEETYQALVASMQQEFGYVKSQDSLSPGESRPRTTAFKPLATTGRAKKKDTASGGVPEKAPTGEDPLVRIVRPGQMTAVGSVVFFEMGSDAFNKSADLVLKDLATQLRGKPQKIEVRGHVSAEYAARTAGTGEATMLGIRRAAAVQRYLVDVAGVKANRFRISSAGDSEPMSRGGRGSAASQNSRVEVFMLDETVDDLTGTSAEREATTIRDNVSTREQP